jgi:hypothetical protein
VLSDTELAATVTGFPGYAAALNSRMKSSEKAGIALKFLEIFIKNA